MNLDSEFRIQKQMQKPLTEISGFGGDRKIKMTNRSLERERERGREIFGSEKELSLGPLDQRVNNANPG